MKYLDSIELINMQTEVLREGTRMEIDSSDIENITQALYTAVISLDEEDRKGMVAIVLEDVYKSINLVKQVNYVKVPDSIRKSLIMGLKKLKYEICLMAYDYYSINEFQPTPEVVEIMQDVVNTYYGE